MKPVEWRPRARLDAAETAYWYAQQGGLPLAERFLAQVESALESIARHPAIGSPRRDDPNAYFLKALILEDGTRFDMLRPGQTR